MVECSMGIDRATVSTLHRINRLGCLCHKSPWRRASTIFARLNRAELGDFDALALGLFLMTHFEGKAVVPDFRFCGREGHVSLIRESRLVSGVNSLGEVPPKLRQAVLLI